MGGMINTVRDPRGCTEQPLYFFTSSASSPVFPHLHPSFSPKQCCSLFKTLMGDGFWVRPAVCNFMPCTNVVRPQLSYLISAFSVFWGLHQVCGVINRPSLWHAEERCYCNLFIICAVVLMLPVCFVSNTNLIFLSDQDDTSLMGFTVHLITSNGQFTENNRTWYYHTILFQIVSKTN